METLPPLLVLCEKDPKIIGGFFSYKEPVVYTFDIFTDASINSCWTKCCVSGDLRRHGISAMSPLSVGYFQNTSTQIRIISMSIIINSIYNITKDNAIYKIRHVFTRTSERVSFLPYKLKCGKSECVMNNAVFINMIFRSVKVLTVAI